MEWLAERFEVSAQTVRRDIIRLDQRRLLQRFHGGAGALEGTIRLGYAQKQSLAVNAKDAIGATAAARVSAGATIFLDVGTTVEAAAKALAGRQTLRVFTNSMASAMHDLALIGLSGWDEDGAPMDFDLDKIAVKRTAIARAHQTLALCDASKVARAAPGAIGEAE